MRVGYYLTADYQEIAKDGSFSGFSYDYFVQLQKYTHWQYEFVQESYADCLAMLMRGEIDVMAGITRTPEREKQLLFSRMSVSNSQNKLYARYGAENMFYESYDTFDGCRVAMVRGMRTDEPEDYCALHGFSLNVVTYDTMAACEQALLTGEVELICASSLSDEVDTKIVGRMTKQPLYYAVAKDRQDLADGLDNAMQKITDNNPDFYAQMTSKYMISGANATATFTREEKAFIDSGEPVYLIVNPAWAPICWYDEEQQTYRGVFVDVTKRIEEISGLHFEWVTEEAFNEKVAKEPELENRVVAILADDTSWAEQQNVWMSNHVADTSVVMVTKYSEKSAAASRKLTIAMPRRFYISHMMQDSLANNNVVYYDTVQDCLDAVNSGRADGTFVNELVSTYYLSMLEYSNLFATANSGYYENLAFAVNKDTDLPLLSILDKSLLCLGTTEMEQIVVQNSIAEERFSWKGLYYSNPVMAIGGAMLAVLLLAGAAGAILYVGWRRRRTEQTLKAEFETSNARTEFFMMISHELRTPLNAIVGYLNLAAAHLDEDAPCGEYVKRAKNAAGQLSGLADDMLDYTRIASDATELQEVLLDVKDVVRGVDQNICVKAVEKDQKYRFIVENLEHEYVVGDAKRVTQVLQNILSNAVKFTPAGGTVEAMLSEREQGAGKVELVFRCRDSGRGMSKEFLAKVCAPFQQGDRAYSRTNGGVGLGLFLTKYYVEAMHGTLQVESVEGEGSCFTVALPLQCADSGHLLDSNVSCAHVRAIVCDTDEANSEHIRELLKRLKIKCDAAENEEKLLRRLQTRAGGPFAYSLCILDDSCLAADEKLPEKVAQGEGAPAVFALTSDVRQIDALRGSPDIRRVLYKPVFQSALFDAVLNEFGEYKAEKSELLVPDLTGIKAMIAEDNAINADILTRVLAKAHVQADVCENGRIAVETFERAAEGTYQIVFMDIQMPEMNGYEAAKRLRASEKPQGATIPIVAVSANAFPEDIEKSLQSGMNEHLSKPVIARKLYEVIEKYCGSAGKPNDK